jgi:hypothetical protein
MELRRAQAIADPFLSAVRRRHPDADLVVLPPGRPPDPPPPLADHEALAAAALRVGERADALWPVLDEPVPADVRWAHGPGADAVVALSRLVRTAHDRQALAEVSTALADAGEVRRPSGVVERLVVESPGTTTAVSWAPTTGVLVVEVRSAAVVVGAALVRDLTREGPSEGGGS